MKENHPPKVELTELHITRVYSDGTTQTINRRFDLEKRTQKKLRIVAANDNAKITEFENHLQILLRVKRKPGRKMTVKELLNKSIQLLTSLIINLHENEF